MINGSYNIDDLSNLFIKLGIDTSDVISDFNVVPGSTYYSDGYNILGYDKYGYDKDGYDFMGYDKDGYDRKRSQKSC